MGGRKAELNLVSAMLGTLILIMAYTTIVLQTFSWMLLAVITLTSLLVLALLRSERETFWRSQGTIRRLSTAARISVASILASVLTSMSMTILDAIIVGSVNWYMLIFLGQVSAIALLTLQLLKKRNFVVESEFSIVPFAVSVLVVTTLLMVYSYFFADQVRWSNHYGVLTALLLVLMVATVARR